MSVPKISVIVPVYKVENYLCKCVDSLLAQTFQDFELLLIDDGSPDRSGEICDEYAKKDNRIRVFHIPNSGVSAARNLGIEKSAAEWICFVDSDDYVGRMFLEDFGLNKFEANLYLQGYSILAGSSIIKKHHFDLEYISLMSLDKVFLYGELNNILNSPVCKLFKMSIVKKNKIKFDVNISFGEDHLFVLSYLSQIQNYAVVSPAVSYNYVHYNGHSLTRRIIPYKEMSYYAIKAYQYQSYLVNKFPQNRKSAHIAINWRTYSNMAVALKNYIMERKYSFCEYKYIHSIYKSLICGYGGLNMHQMCLKFFFIGLPVYISYGCFCIISFLYYLNKH